MSANPQVQCAGMRSFGCVNGGGFCNKWKQWWEVDDPLCEAWTIGSWPHGDRGRMNDVPVSHLHELRDQVSVHPSAAFDLADNNSGLVHFTALSSLHIGPVSIRTHLVSAQLAKQIYYTLTARVMVIGLLPSLKKRTVIRPHSDPFSLNRVL